MNPVLWQAMGTEFILIFGVLFMVLSQYWLHLSERLSHIFYTIIIGTALVWTILYFPDRTIIVSHIYKSNYFTGLLEIMLLTSVMVFDLIKIKSTSYSREQTHTYIFQLLSMSGFLIASGAMNLMLMYVGIELFSVSILLLMNCVEEQDGTALLDELNWQVLGSGMMLLGMSIIGWRLGSLRFSVISNMLSQLPYPDSTFILAGIISISVGIMVKLGIVPFHGWLLRLQEHISLYCYVVVYCLISLFVIVIGSRLICNILWPADMYRSYFITVIGGSTVAVGFLSSFVATDAKRWLIRFLLGFQGFLILGLDAVKKFNLRAGFPDGLTASVFHWIVTTTALILWLLLWEHIIRSGFMNSKDRFASIALGLFIALVMGVPMTAGFTSRMYLFGALLIQHKWIASGLLLGGSAIVAYSIFTGYQKIMVLTYSPAAFSKIHFYKNAIFISILCVAVIYLGLFPSLLMSGLTRCLQAIW